MTPNPPKPPQRNTYKDELFLSIRQGQGVEASQLDKALAGVLTSEAQDLVLVSHWLLSEQNTAGRNLWWNERNQAQVLYDLHLASLNQNAGWGGRVDYPMTMWVHEHLQEHWAAVYMQTLDELVVPLLGGGPFNAAQLREAAIEEAKLRITALVGAALPQHLHDKGEHLPLVKLLGEELYETVRKRRRHVQVEAADFYALAVTHQQWNAGASKEPRMCALIQAKIKGLDHYRAYCDRLLFGQRYINVQETGADTFTVTVIEVGKKDPIKDETFSTTDESFQHAVQWTDSLRAHCREHNRTLSIGYYTSLSSKMETFLNALKTQERESGADLARKAAASLSPSLDAASAVRMLRARITPPGASL